MIGGRLFNFVSDGRYAATDPVDNPVMALEYFKRSQNWSESGNVPLIRTGSSEGAYDHSSLDEIKLFPIARQFFNESDMWTDVLCKSICETFFLVAYQDSDGYECVQYLFRDDTPSDTVAIGDIVPGSIGLIENPKSEVIYVEPTINYAYDYATGKFTQSMKVLGIAENSSWNIDLTPGFNEYYGEIIWNQCKVNFLRYKKKEKMPGNLSDMYWITNYSTAVWRLQNFLLWTTRKKFSFSIFYETGRQWYVGKQIYINFPNETNSYNIRSVITGIQRDKKNNRVNLKLVLLEDVPVQFYYTMYQMTDNASLEWQLTDDAENEMQEAG